MNFADKCFVNWWLNDVAIHRKIVKKCLNIRKRRRHRADEVHLFLQLSETRARVDVDSHLKIKRFFFDDSNDYCFCQIESNRDSMLVLISADRNQFQKIANFESLNENFFVEILDNCDLHIRSHAKANVFVIDVIHQRFFVRDNFDKDILILL